MDLRAAASHPHEQMAQGASGSSNEAKTAKSQQAPARRQARRKGRPSHFVPDEDSPIEANARRREDLQVGAVVCQRCPASFGGGLPTSRSESRTKVINLCAA